MDEWSIQTKGGIAGALGAGGVAYAMGQKMKRAGIIAAGVAIGVYLSSYWTG